MGRERARGGRDVPPPSEWDEQAACRGFDTDLFYPPRGGDWVTPWRVCVGCPVRMPCADWGMAHERYGTWGGLSEVVRRSKRRFWLRMGEAEKRVFLARHDAMVRRAARSGKEMTG